MLGLQFFQGSTPLFDYKLISRRVRIGRSDSCDIALPGTEISRQHCILERQGDDWFLSDQSKHGTLINGRAIQKKEALAKGDRVQIGLYSFEMMESLSEAKETAEVIPKQDHEFVFRSGRDLLIERAQLKIRSGTQEGMDVFLSRSSYSLGAKGSDIELVDLRLPEHCQIHVSRGRVIVVPKRGPVYFEGQRLNKATPIFPGEEFRVGVVSIQIQREIRQNQRTRTEFANMVGVSAKMQKIFGLFRLFAAHDFPVLISGESGTGKELAARAIHDSSTRSSGQFVALNCGAIPENLVESLLFGYKKGAFSGAFANTDGAFQQANDGTLFLDEIGDLPLSAQVKLLRALEGGEVRRIGSLEVEYPNVRIIAATNKDLRSLISKGLFREDLFFRLQVLSVHLPPLRERNEDIPLLVRDICRNLSSTCTISQEAIDILKRYRWNGNIRELRNVLSRAFVLSGGNIDIEHVEVYDISTESDSFYAKEDKKPFLDDSLAFLLEKHKGNRSAMARELGIPRTTLLYKLQQAGLI